MKQQVSTPLSNLRKVFGKLLEYDICCGDFHDPPVDVNCHRLLQVDVPRFVFDLFQPFGKLLLEGRLFRFEIVASCTSLTPRGGGAGFWNVGCGPSRPLIIFAAAAADGSDC